MIFKKSTNSIFYRLLLTHLLVFLVFLNAKLNILALVICWLVIVVFPEFVLSFFHNLKTIEIQDKKLKLTFIKWFKQVIETYDYSELTFTYKEQMGGKGSASMEFRVYKNNSDKSIISIGGSFDGWSDDKIYEMIETLHKIGIKVIE